MIKGEKAKSKIVLKSVLGVSIIALIVLILIVLALRFFVFFDRTVTLITETGYSEDIATYETNSITLEQFLVKSGVAFDKEKDRANVPYDSILKKENTIVLEKYLDISLTYGDKTFSGNIFDLDKEELVEFLGVEVKDNIVYPNGNSILKFSEADLDSIEIKYSFSEDELSFEDESVFDDTLTIGDSYVSQKGITGLDDSIYLEVYKDGSLVTKTLVRKERVREIQNRVRTYGTKIDWSIPEDLEYIDVLTGGTAYSYYYGGRPYGCYGLNCSYHTCAVDSAVIPLGTKMYITGYGYVIANDVGIGVDGLSFDLYMECWKQCSIWGRRTVTCYIIEYGDNTNNWTRYKREESPKYYNEDGELVPSDNWPYSILND